MKFLDTCILFIHRLLLQKMNHKVQRNTRRAVNKIFYILFSVCVFVSPMILQNKQTNKPNYWILRYLPESISKVKITLTSLVVSFWKLQINKRKVYSYFSSFVLKNMINVSYNLPATHWLQSSKCTNLQVLGQLGWAWFKRELKSSLSVRKSIGLKKWD